MTTTHSGTGWPSIWILGFMVGYFCFLRVIQDLYLAGVVSQVNSVVVSEDE